MARWKSPSATGAIAVPTASAASNDPEYLHGFRAAVTGAFDYSVAVIEHIGGEGPAIPASLLVQARVAARNGVRLDTVLRRYIVGSTLLDEIIIAEASPDELQPVLRARAIGLERLLSEITEEHGRETSRRATSRRNSQLRQVQRLLDGEPTITSSLEYDFELNHVGLAAYGPDVEKEVRSLAAAIDARLLLVHPGENQAWAWLGRRQSFDKELVETLASQTPSSLTLALGEPLPHLNGWRWTHRQAKTALPVAMRGSERVVRYSDVCLLAATLQDDLLTKSLRSAYLDPITNQGGGARYLDTLRAYFATNRNGVSAAAVLGVSRQTVNSRLRAVEEALGRPLETCTANLELALEIDSMGAIH